MSILGWILLYLVISVPISIFVGTVIRRMGEDVPNERE